MLKGSTYWTKERVLKTGGYTAIPVLALFGLLIAMGSLNVTDLKYSEHCAGTPDDLCYLCFNATPTQIITIQANDTWMETTPPVKKLTLKRKWSTYWRTIDLSKTWSSRVKYALRLYPGKTYEFCFYAEKEHPYDEINWSLNPSGVWGKALAKQKCLEYKEITKYTKTKSITEVCENITNNITKIDEKHCYNKTNIIKKPYTKQVCVSEGITYVDGYIERKKSTNNLTHICVDDKQGSDGNGDGICQSGETCYCYKLGDTLELDKVTNGNRVITKNYPKNYMVKLK